MPHQHRNPLALLTPTMHKVLERMHRAQKIPMHAMTPQQARSAYAGAADVLDIPPQATERVESFSVVARDAGLKLALQLLFYPGTAGHQDTPSHRRFAKGFVLEEPHITYFFEQHIRSAADRDDWRFAPLDGLRPDGQVADLGGVAPAWLGLAECDPLVDEGVAFADRLRMAGVAVDLEIYKGVVHEFIKMGRALPQAAQAHADAARALRHAFAL